MLHELDLKKKQAAFLKNLDELLRPENESKFKKEIGKYLNKTGQHRWDEAAIGTGVGFMADSGGVKHAADAGTVPFILVGSHATISGLVNAFRTNAQANAKLATYENAEVDEKAGLECKKILGQNLKSQAKHKTAYHFVGIGRYALLAALVGAALVGSMLPGGQIIGPLASGLGAAQCAHDAFIFGKGGFDASKFEKEAGEWLKNNPITYSEKHKAKFEINPINSKDKNNKNFSVRLTKAGRRGLIRRIAKNLKKHQNDKKIVKWGLGLQFLYYTAILIAMAVGAASLATGIGWAVGGVLGIGFAAYLMHKNKTEQNEIAELENQMAGFDKEALENEISQIKFENPNFTHEEAEMEAFYNILGRLTELDQNVAQHVLIDLIKDEFADENDNQSQAANFAKKLGLKEEIINALRELPVGSNDITEMKKGDIKDNKYRSIEQNGIDLLEQQLG